LTSKAKNWRTRQKGTKKTVNKHHQPRGIFWSFMAVAKREMKKENLFSAEAENSQVEISQLGAIKKI
jgi:hypothetical protein